MTALANLGTFTRLPGFRWGAAAPWPIRLLPLSTFEAVVRHGIHKSVKWVDDDKGTATVSMAWNEKGERFFTQTEPLASQDGRDGIHHNDVLGMFQS